MYLLLPNFHSYPVLDSRRYISRCLLECPWLQCMGWSKVSADNGASLVSGMLPTLVRKYGRGLRKTSRGVIGNADGSLLHPFPLFPIPGLGIRPSPLSYPWDPIQTLQTRGAPPSISNVWVTLAPIGVNVHLIYRPQSWLYPVAASPYQGFSYSRPTASYLAPVSRHQKHQVDGVDGRQ